MRIGVISDTHGYLDPKVLELFRGVSWILHAGDVGPPSLILELEEIAPVTAVVGNSDPPCGLRETETVELAGREFLIHHLIELDSTTTPIRRRILREAPDVVVFGHSHKPHQEPIGRTLFLNPGYAGRQRFSLLRTVALVNASGKDLSVEFHAL